MSTVYYAKLWLQARKDLESVIQMDANLQERMQQPTKELKQAGALCLDLYYRYRAIIRRITESHDQLIQPQVREIVGRILDFAIIRMLEIRNEVVGLLMSECSWPIDTLLRLKLTPDDINLSRPSYDLGAKLADRERRQRIVKEFAIQQRDLDPFGVSSSTLLSDAREESMLSSVTTTTMTTTLMSRSQIQDDDLMDAEEEIPKNETWEEREARLARTAELRRWKEAAMLIQSHERARQARVVALSAQNRLIAMRRIMEEDEAGVRASGFGHQEVQHVAACVIQRAWRSHRARREARRRLDRLDEAYGMIRSSYRDKRIFERHRAVYRNTLDQQTKAAEEFKIEYERRKNKLYETRGPELVDDIRHETRDWMIMWFEEIGFFDHIPPAQFGGTKLVVTGASRTPMEYFNEMYAGKDDKAKKDTKTPNKDEKKKIDEGTWSMPESRVFEDLVHANQEYLDDWLHHTDKILDPDNPIIVDAITEEVCYQLQLEMRPIADEYSRADLARLNKGLAADKQEEFTLPDHQDYEALVAGSDENSKQSKKKKPPRSRTESLVGVTDDELLIELSLMNVLRELPEEELDDWPGAPALGFEPYYEMRLGDVKQPIIDYCVLPIASKVVNELGPSVRSVCICGPPRSAPEFLARAVCHELQATVFDLTPDRYIGRFTSAAALTRLTQAVGRLARAYAPSVILVENESAWRKSVPNHMKKVKAFRFLRVYQKIIKDIMPGDQVLFLTASTEPYSAGGSFTGSFDRIVVVPEADYGTLARAYRLKLDEQHHVDRRFDVSCLARLMARVTPLDFAQDVLQESLGIARRMRFAKEPLTQTEILETYLERNPGIAPGLKSFAGFRYKKIKVEKARKKVEDEMRMQEAALAKAKKKSK